MNHLVKIDVTIDTRDSNQVFAFSNLMQAIGKHKVFNIEEAFTQQPESVASTEKPKATKTKAKKEEVLEAQTELPTETPLGYTVEEETPQQEQSEATEEVSIKIEDIRKLVAEKLADHRDTIKTKLGDFETKNVTNLPEKHYAAFHDFLASLN